MSEATTFPAPGAGARQIMRQWLWRGPSRSAAFSKTEINRRRRAVKTFDAAEFTTLNGIDVPCYDVVGRFDSVAARKGKTPSPVHPFADLIWMSSSRRSGRRGRPEHGLDPAQTHEAALCCVQVGAVAGRADEGELVKKRCGIIPAPTVGRR